MNIPDDNELAIRSRLITLIDGPPPAAQPDAVGAAAEAAVAQPRIPEQPHPDDVDDLREEATASGTAAPDADAEPTSRIARLRIQPWWTGRHVDLSALNEDTEEEAAEVSPDADPDADDDADEESECADVQPDAQPDTASDAQLVRKTRFQMRIPRISTGSGDPAAAGDSVVAAPAPQMSLLDAFDRVPRRIRWLCVHLTSAAVGYHFGLVQWSTRTSAWLAAHGWNNINGYFLVGCALGCELLRRRARHSFLPARIVAAIPIASIVTGTLLYGTGWQNLELPL